MRVSFLVDGFNLYHSLCEAQRDLGGQSTKWLNLKSLCQSYMYLFGRSATFQEIHYFSALATHREVVDPDVTNRHRRFIECLKAEGVTVELSRFKAKDNRCPDCGYLYKRYEEKETDVKLALRLLEVFVHNTCDLVVLITGDTDLAPPVRTAKQLFPSKEVRFAFPYKRENRELRQLLPQSFSIKKEQYLKHQFPDPYVLSSGKKIIKPIQW